MLVMVCVFVTFLAIFIGESELLSRVADGLGFFFRSHREYRLEGSVYLYDGDKLYGQMKRMQSTNFDSQDYHSYEAIVFNVIDRESLATRYDQELIVDSSSELNVNKSSTIGRTLFEADFKEYLGRDVDPEAELRVLLSDRRPHYDTMEILTGESMDYNIMSLLKDNKWSITEQNESSCSLKTQIPKIGEIALSVELDPNFGVRPIRLSRTYRPGDVRDGSVLPTKDTRTFQSVTEAFWDRDRLARIVLSTIHESPTGEKGGRKDNWVIEKAFFKRGEGQFNMQMRIPNNTPVFLTQSPQLKAEWRDGEVVKVYASGDVASLKNLKFANKPFNWTFWLSMAAVAVLGAFGWFMLRKSKT
jgi:hypothetical protein